MLTDTVSDGSVAHRDGLRQEQSAAPTQTHTHTYTQTKQKEMRHKNQINKLKYAKETASVCLAAVRSL